MPSLNLQTSKYLLNLFLFKHLYFIAVQTNETSTYLVIFAWLFAILRLTMYLHALKSHSWFQSIDSLSEHSAIKYLRS